MKDVAFEVIIVIFNGNCVLPWLYF